MSNDHTVPTVPNCGARAYLRELAAHARRAAIASDHDLPKHIELLARQMPVIAAIRDTMASDWKPVFAEAAR